MEEFARGSRERRLRTHAIPSYKKFQRHGNGRRQADRLAARILQTQHGLHGKLGREDGIRRGHAISGIQDTHLKKESTDT